MKKMKIIYYIIGIFVTIFIFLGAGYLYFYTGKIQKLQCQTNSSYFQNQRNFLISFQRNLPIKLENWSIYTTDIVNEEFNNLYQENEKINDFRKSQKNVVSSVIDKAENSFTIYTIVDMRWMNDKELGKIDGFYQMIFERGKDIQSTKEYLEKNNYTCTIQ